MTYTLQGHGQLLADRRRLAAYEQAMRQTIRPGDTVVDLGAGMGIMSLMACRLGARKVYAIEPNPSIHCAREVAAANGMADRIVCIQAMSTDVTLPERAEVIVSDLRSVLPLWENHLPSIRDARERFLAPGGTLIPAVDTLWAAVVTAPDLHRQITAPWDGDAYGFDLGAGRQRMLNTNRKGRFTQDSLLTAPQQWHRLDYTQDNAPSVAVDLVWEGPLSGVGHGIALWFETQLTADVGYSNAPSEPPLIYGQGFLPWLEPVDLADCNAIKLRLRADHRGGGYLWSWRTRFSHRPAFTQSTHTAQLFNAT